MAEIFLYTADAQINSTHLQALRKNGFIPVKVATMDAVKIMPMPVALPKAHVDLAARAAFLTITAYSQGPSAEFGRTFAKLMAEALAPEDIAQGDLQ